MNNLSLLKLCVGYQILDSIIEEKLFVTSFEVEEGKFHFETKFDTQTGIKQAPIKVWDSNPKSNKIICLNIDGKKYKTDPLTFVKVMSEKLECSVERFGDKESNTYGYSFFVNNTLPYRKITDQFALSSPTIYLDEVASLQDKLFALSFQLRRLGLVVDEPRVFISQYYV